MLTSNDGYSAAVWFNSNITNLDFIYATKVTLTVASPRTAGLYTLSLAFVL